MNKIKNTIEWLLILIFLGGIIYGMYWAGKSFSYSFFYEDMVIRSIHQQVKPECIK